MEMTESTKVGMHVTGLESIFRKAGDRFFTFQELADAVIKESSWAELAFISPALEKMISWKQVEHDPKKGYCLPGVKKRLEENQNAMARSDFDRLTAAEKMAFCNNSGRVV